MVHITGERDDRGGRLAPLARRDRALELGELDEGALEGGPVLEVHGLPHLLSCARHAFAPGSRADGLVPRLEVVQRGREQVGERGRHQQMVEAPGGVALDPRPLLVVDH